ncbi:FACT complex subunit SSRP1-like [Rhincodon typus]|uniref:FACT complex subunit SSRP1-like n=1 Tax=Rhincodon typus TaxID=259920 RepID=UPI00202DD916|nr:FACT complex subunit SSRP1-like [Rhincodon typus]
MELQSGKVEAARRPQAPPRTDFASSPFVAVQPTRKAAVRTEPAICSAAAAAAVVGGGSGAVPAYCGNRAGGDTATFIGSVPVTVSLENFDGQHRIVCVTTDANGGTLSYVGQLNSDVNLELQAAGDTKDSANSGNKKDEIYYDKIPNAFTVAQSPHSRPLKGVKRKGGWPKGKKRKPQKDFTAPRAPTTGYVLFLNEQRAKLKIEHPDLPFTEITKLLGTQWSQLSQEGKQKYIDEAEKDKQRYIEELKAYQNSEAYQAFLKRRAMNKVKNLCGVESLDTEFESEAVVLSEIGVSKFFISLNVACNKHYIF